MCKRSSIRILDDLSLTNCWTARICASSPASKPPESWMIRSGRCSCLISCPTSCNPRWRSEILVYMAYESSKESKVEILTTSFACDTPNTRLTSVDFPTPVFPQTRTRIDLSSSISDFPLSVQNPGFVKAYALPIIFDLHFSSFSRSCDLIWPAAVIKYSSKY